MSKDQIIEIIQPYYRLMSEVMRDCSRNKQMEFSKLSRKIVVIGSITLGYLKTWENDNDLDFYLYEPVTKIRDKDLRRIDNLIPGYVEQAVKLDFLPSLSTDMYTNNKNLSLTDYLFDEKKELYTQRLGLMRALTFEGFFITKLAAICDRDLETDYLALKVVFDYFGSELPEEIEKVISDFGLEKCYNKFRDYNASLLFPSP